MPPLMSLSRGTNWGPAPDGRRSVGGGPPVAIDGRVVQVPSTFGSIATMWNRVFKNQPNPRIGAGNLGGANPSAGTKDAIHPPSFRLQVANAAQQNTAPTTQALGVGPPSSVIFTPPVTAGLKT